ncbi:carotenoid oxygenase family protein [Mycolicibacterium fortuitum]|uniref:carotenoid oxygenase family protein n=1 Tax=Mycolicibacterium fortuitum TaxID=1766 RepID=UPI00148FFF38|nr:carotenoid oxygenase [Mycolicibacterium fortuitum]
MTLEMNSASYRSPFLQGNFAPIREETTETDLEVIGEIPEYLAGRYVRGGNSPLEELITEEYEWFAANGMAFGVRLRDGRAEWYRNRWIRTTDVCNTLGLSQPPGPCHAGMDYTLHTNVIQQAGRTFMITEGGPNPYELNYELESLGFVNFPGSPYGGGYASHPHKDPETNEWHAIQYYLGGGQRASYTILDENVRIRRSVEFELNGCPILHDFALTENYIVVYDLPLQSSVESSVGSLPAPIRKPLTKVLKRLHAKGLPESVLAGYIRTLPPQSARRLPLQWDPDYSARIGVMRRDGDASSMRWFDVERQHVWHTLNAFEADSKIYVDFVSFPRAFDIDHSWPNPAEGQPVLSRVTLDLDRGRASNSHLDELPQEFPRINDMFFGKEYRYGYTVGALEVDPRNRSGIMSSADHVFKHNMSTGEVVRSHLGDGAAASEFTFVADPDGAHEDSGVLMGYVYRADEDRSDYVILDAETLQEVAVIKLPVRVTFGYHGNWLPD